MSALTLQYQYPEETQRTRAEKPRAYKRQVPEALDTSGQTERVRASHYPFGSIALDSTVMNQVLANFQAQNLAGAALYDWASWLTQTGSGDTELLLKAPFQAFQSVNSVCHYTPSPLVNEAEECSKLLLQALWAAVPPEKYASELVKSVRKHLLGAKGPARESALAAIFARVADLRLLATEEEIQVSGASFDDLKKFIEQLPFTVAPLVFLMDEGTFRLVWRGDKEQVALEFLGNKTIRYVFFAARPEPVSEAKSAGIDDTSHIVGQIRALGLAHLIGHVG